MSSGSGGVDLSNTGSVIGAVVGSSVGAFAGPVGMYYGAQEGSRLGGDLPIIGKKKEDGSDGNSVGGENDLVARLMAQATGQGGPSPAEMQMMAGLDAANRQGMGMAAAQRGINPALAARLAADTQAANQQANAQASGIMRAGESQQANQLLGGIFASQRGGQLQQQQMNQQKELADRQMLLNLISAGGNAAMAGSTGGAGKYKGGMIDGKAPVPGDHPANDKVPAKLSPGEMVIPRTVVAKGPQAIKTFAEKLLEKEGGK